MKPVGKPGAGNRHARFDDERGWETGALAIGPNYRAHPRLYLSDMLRRHTIWGRKRGTADIGPSAGARCTVASDPSATSARVVRVSGRYSEFLTAWSHWLDACELDHLCPLVGLSGNERAEVGWRAGKDRASEFSKARLYLGIGEARVHFLIEFLHDVGRRIPRRTQPEPSARLVTSQELPDRGNI